MARLSSKMSPLLSGSVIENLSKGKILTVEDVLKKDAQELKKISVLNFMDVVSLRKTLMTDYSPFPQKGFDAYSEFVSNCTCIHSGIKSLDRLLGGGFFTGNIYEVCGMSGTGKTQLCLTLAINEAKQQKTRVHFVDTKADFSGKRVLSILDARLEGAEETASIMERILVSRVHSFFKLYSFLCHLKEQLIREPGSTRLIIIESLPAIFFQFMGNMKLDSLGLLNYLASLMKYIAQEQHVTFILVNLATKWSEEESSSITTSESGLPPINPLVEIKPVLGKYWVHIPNTRVYIEKQDHNSRKMTVIKSTHLEVGESCLVKIEDGGVLSNME